MKKIILTILLVFVLTGCSNAGLEFEFGATDKKLKATSDKILSYEKIKDKNDNDIVKYNYLSDVLVEVEKINHKGKELTEIIEKREKNARIYQDGEETVAQIYGSKAFLKDNGVWKHTEIATSTIADFEKETDYTVAKNKNFTLFGIRTALAASPESIFGDTGAGYVGYDQTATTWTAATTATTGTAYNLATMNTTEYWLDATSRAQIYRGFIPFDTSIIPDDATITAAVINLFVFTIYNGDPDANGHVGVYDGTQAATSTIVATDYDNVGGTALSNTIDYGNLVDEAYNAFTLTAGGRSNISLTVHSKFSTRGGHDVANDQPATGTDNGMAYYSPAQAGTSNDPYIVITYTQPAAADATFYEPLMMGVIE